MSVVWGARECADAFLLISVLFSYVCCLGGARECADAFLLISVLFSYVCCLGGKGMRRCIPVDFCSVFLCLLFWGEGNAQMHSVGFLLSFYACCLGGRECAEECEDAFL